MKQITAFCLWDALKCSLECLPIEHVVGIQLRLVFFPLGFIQESFFFLETSLPELGDSHGPATLYFSQQEAENGAGGGGVIFCA